MLAKKFGSANGILSASFPGLAEAFIVVRRVQIEEHAGTCDRDFNDAVRLALQQPVEALPRRNLIDLERVAPGKNGRVTTMSSVGGNNDSAGILPGGIEQQAHSLGDDDRMVRWNQDPRRLRIGRFPVCFEIVRNLMQSECNTVSHLGWRGRRHQRSSCVPFDLALQ